MRDHNYYMYMMANRTNRVLYIGMTNNLERRVSEHQSGEFPGFTRKYKVNKLVYYEHYSEVESAIRREKQLKGWRREKKNQLIESMNPNWDNLTRTWE
ncbi:MAG: GIY-YIG nuclease family protein [Phycisphaerae bacterium]|nr:GIY-YIG nuclease family protein [Phycisphaerae bacterium]